MILAMPLVKPKKRSVSFLVMFGLSCLTSAGSVHGDVRLLRLPGDTVNVMYSAGTLDRASHVQRRLEALAGALTKWTKHPYGMTVYVLTRADWEASNAGPYYGIPGRVTGDSLSIAAEGDIELAAFWARLLGRPAARLPGYPLIGPAEGADALAVSDLFLQLESTAVMLRQAGWSSNTPLTMRLAVHLAAWDVLAVREPTRVGELDRVFADLARWPTEHEQGQGMEIEAWVSLESEVYRASNWVRSAVDKSATKKVLKAAEKNGGVISMEPITDKDKQLKAQLQEWSRTWATVMPEATPE